MNGILLIDKPEGWTSHDVAAKLKGILRERRIGHSGTLDPMATGLLVMFVGRATRAVEFAEAQSKRYIAGLRLGVSTDTQDTTGNILRSCEASVTRAALSDAIKPFIGDIMQVPPMYSAIKINGQKLYDIARRGGEVERKPRLITIYGIEILGGEAADWTLDVECSKGTYIRTLCNDIGDSLNVGGCMSLLRRIRAGDFSVDDAHSIEDIQRARDAGEVESLLIPVDSLFGSAGKYVVNGVSERKLRCGNDFSCTAPDGEYRVYSQAGEFLALCRADKGCMKTIKSFFEV